MRTHAQLHLPPEPAPLVVLVEDDPVMGQSIADWLAVRGYRHTWLRTGSEAAERIPSLQPDILICDIRLPDMSGRGAAYRCQEEPSRDPGALRHRIRRGRASGEANEGRSRGLRH